MKQETKIVAIVLTLLIVFLSGFGLGATRGINIKIEGAAVQTGGQVAQAAPQTTTQAPQTTTAAPQTTTQAPAADSTTAAPSGDATTAAPSGSSSVPSTKAEIAAAYNKAINDLRAYSGKVTMKKTDDVKIEVTDLPAAAASIINSAVQGFTGVTTSEYTFENGADVADPNRKLVEKIIPWNRDASVQEAGLASASATANADGGYTMTMTFVPEDSVFDGNTNTSEPTYHMGAMDPLNLGTIELPSPISITSANLHYPGATLTATVDGQGRIVKIDNKLPLEGQGSGKAIVSLTINMKGSMDSAYEFIYA